MSDLTNQAPASKWHAPQTLSWNPDLGRGGANQNLNWNANLSSVSNHRCSSAGQVPDSMHRAAYPTNGAATTPHPRYPSLVLYPGQPSGINQGMPLEHDRVAWVAPGSHMGYSPQQQRLCVDGGCTGIPGAPFDPYICASTDPSQPSCCNSSIGCSDCTFGLMILFLLLIAGGLGAIFGTNTQDDLFRLFDTTSSQDFDTQMLQFIKINKGSCTRRKLVGSFGNICMERNLVVNVFAVQLSQWNNARDSLWALALIYTLIAVLYALFISLQRQASGPGEMGTGETILPLSHERAQELNQMSSTQQQYFAQEHQKHFSETSSTQTAVQMHNHYINGTDNCSTFRIDVYDTPFYEFMRISWLFIGFTTLAWTTNLLISFCSFSSFYKDHMLGRFHGFWVTYERRFLCTLIVITVYLAWPIFNFFIELIVFIVFIIPWLIIRTICFPQIGNYRPGLPLSKLPGWIRIDMFFMDMQDIRRLGFSRQAWIILTGGERMLCNNDDPEVDRDPSMTSLRLRREQWHWNIYGVPPPWAHPVKSVAAMPVPNTITPSADHGNIQQHNSNRTQTSNEKPPMYSNQSVGGQHTSDEVTRADNITNAMPSPKPTGHSHYPVCVDSTNAITNKTQTAGPLSEGLSHSHRRRRHRRHSLGVQDGEKGHHHRVSSRHDRRHRRRHSHKETQEAVALTRKSPEVQSAIDNLARIQTQDPTNSPPAFPVNRFDTENTPPRPEHNCVPNLSKDGREGGYLAGRGVSPPPVAQVLQWPTSTGNNDSAFRGYGIQNEGKHSRDMGLDDIMKL